jgi:hypothetical protein
VAYVDGEAVLDKPVSEIRGRLGSSSTTRIFISISTVTPKTLEQTALGARVEITKSPAFFGLICGRHEL